MQRKLIAVGLLLVLTLFAGAASAAGASVFLEDQTWTELRGLIDSGTTTIIVPIGGTEQNGPAIALGKHNARVKALAGKIAERRFEDGADLKKGQLLFTIDQRPFKAQLDSAVAGVKLGEAKLQLAKQELKRVENAPTGSSQAELDRARAELKIAEATLAGNQATQEMAQQNFDYTVVTAEHTGRVSDRRVHPGAIIKANDTLLTTLVVLDPINVAFDIDERTVLRLRSLIDEGRIPTAREHQLTFQVGLADPDIGLRPGQRSAPRATSADYPFTAVWDFADNQLDPGTGTLRVKGRMPNPGLHLEPMVRPLNGLVGAAAALDAGRVSLKLLSPNMFVRVRMPIGRPREMILVPEEALGSDQGQKFVYVVTAENKIDYRRVTQGPQEGKLRAVEERKPTDPQGIGVARGERVLVSGHQRVKHGQKVIVRSPAPAAKK